MNEKPNILLFLMDACQASALEEGGGCKTPNFDALAKEGTRFRRAYCPSPTCSPSRASLMTGVLPHNHGVLEVEHGRDPDQCNLRTDLPHWAQRLQAVGYENGYFGKWHIERSQVPSSFGWATSHVKGAGHHAGLGQGIEPSAAVDDLIPELTRYHEGPVGYRDILHYGVSKTGIEKRYPHFTTSEGLEFLQERNSDDPWCLCCSFSEPNEALVASEEVFQEYKVEDIALPINLRDTHEGRLGLYERQSQIGAGITDEEWRMARACYYARITELDRAFGHLLDYLDESGQRENTIVIVTADHGRYVGAHGFDAHNFGPFEEIYRVPLLVSGPGVSAGGSCDAPVCLHDLCPTICEWGGAEEIDVPDSCSLVPAMAGEPIERSGAYAESQGTRFSLTQRIWWQGKWKFAFNGFDFDELYDLETDPGETTNLARMPEYRDTVERMMREVWREIRETGDRAIEETHYFSMRMGVVGPDA